MRAGWNKFLRDRLWAADPTAHVIVEAVAITSEDAKDTRADWNGADSTAGLELLDLGGVQLAPSSATGLDETPAPDLDITTLAPADPFTGVAISWTDLDAQDKEIRNVVVKVDPRVGGGAREVEKWLCRLFRVRAVGPEESQIEMDEIGEQFVDEIGDVIHDVTFNFQRGGRSPRAGDPPELRVSGGATQPDTFPVTVVALYAYTVDGAIAGNCAWRGKSGASTASGSGYTAEHKTYGSFDDAIGSQSNAAGGGLYSEAVGIGFPYITVNEQSYAASATVSFTSNDVDLGAAPTGRVRVIAIGEEPGDSSLAFQIRDDGAGWHDCADGDWVGENNVDSGHDLTTVAKQQTYEMRVTIASTSAQLRTAVARRMGVQEVAIVDLAGAAVVEGCSWRVDPVTLKAEIGQPSIRILKTGERDYRDYFSQIASLYHIGQVQYNILVGHPDLSRQHWLLLDSFDAEDLIPGDSQGTILCLSVLGRLKSLGKIPRASGGTRTAVFIQDSIDGVYDELIDTQIALPARLRGVGIPTSYSDTISKTIKESVPKDELDAVAFLAGHAVISSQGRIKAVQMMEDEGSERCPVMHFPRAEIKPNQLGAGFVNRIDEYFVKYGWDDDLKTWENEAHTSWVLAGFGSFEEKLRARGIESIEELDEETAEWIESEPLADTVALRVVKHHATGLMLWDVESTYPHPYLEPGDVVTVQTDQFAARDPVTDRQIRGIVSAKGTIVEVRNAIGSHFVVWVKSFADIVVTEDAITRSGYAVPEFLQAVATFGTDGSLVLRAQINMATGSVKAVDHASSFRTVAQTQAASSSNVTDGWLEFTLAGASTYDLEDDAYITALAYEETSAGGAESPQLLRLKVTNENDADVDAEITGLEIGFEDDGAVIANVGFDEDAAAGDVYFTVGLGSSPSDPTVGSNDGTVNPSASQRSASVVFDGTGGFANKVAEMGEMVFVKARARNGDSVLFTASEAKRRRGDTEFVPPRVQVTGIRSGNTVTITLEVDDPSLAVTAIQFRKKDSGGSLGSSWLSSWDTSTGTIGSSRSLTRGEGVTSEPGLDARLLWRVGFTDETGATQYEGGEVDLTQLDQVDDRPLRFPHTLMVPDRDSEQWALGDAHMQPVAANVQLDCHMALVLPPGINLTAVRMRGYRFGVSDKCEAIIKKIDDSGQVTSTLATLTHSGTGWTDTPAGLSETVSDDHTYVAEINVKGVASPPDGKFGRIEFDYDRPDYSKVY